MCGLWAQCFALASALAWYDAREWGWRLRALVGMPSPLHEFVLQWAFWLSFSASSIADSVVVSHDELLLGLWHLTLLVGCHVSHVLSSVALLCLCIFSMTREFGFVFRHGHMFSFVADAVMLLNLVSCLSALIYLVAPGQYPVPCVVRRLTCHRCPRVDSRLELAIVLPSFICPFSVTHCR